MRLQLEAFEQVTLLGVSQTVSAGDAGILVAGISRLKGLGRRWLIVDLEHALLDMAALRFLEEASLRTASGGNPEVRTVWVGSLAKFCEFEDLAAALVALKAPELRPISLKLDLETTQAGLEQLLRARARVMVETETNSRTLKELESTFVRTNRGLRAAMTNLINRVLDPAFGDFEIEPLPDTEALREFETSLGLAGRDSGSRQTRIPPGAKLSYSPANLNEAIADLRDAVKTLQGKAAKRFLDGKADRCVSLFIENESLRSQISELSAAWLQRLEADRVVTCEDIEQGFKPMLEASARKEKS